MLVVALLLLLAPLAWLASERLRHAGPAARAAVLRRVTAGVAAVLLLPPIPVGVCGPPGGGGPRGAGGGGAGPGQAARDPPVDPGPDPRPEQLDPDAFDRARAEWERTLKP